MAAEEEWYFEEEGCLQFSGRPTSVTFSPTSNCFICTLKDGTVEVVDARSSLGLKRTEPAVSGEAKFLQCKFCPEVEKLFITNGNVSGLRKDLNGVLLLDSILQPPFKGPCMEPVVFELTLSDAMQLLSAIELCLSSGEDDSNMKNINTVQSLLKEEVDKAQSLLGSSHDKAIKWCTCQLKYACSALEKVFADLITYLQRSHKNHAALPIVAAMQSRTMYLLDVVTTDNRPTSPGNKFPMFMEAVRRKTFSSWPHKEYRWAYPEAMAKAGFYHQPSNRGDDRALCFTCNVCLVCWEPTDEPWAEHERHCPECSFVRGNNTINVPMSVSLATAPACTHESVQIQFISESSCSHFMATCSENGHVIIWDIQDELKIHTEFQVSLPDDVEETPEGDLPSEHFCPPTSFVAWAEPDYEDMEATSSEPEKDSKTAGDPPESKAAELSKEEASSHKNPNEDCNSGQDEKKSAGCHSETIEEETKKEKLVVCTVSIICSCGKDPTNSTSQSCQSFAHTATLLVAILMQKNFTSDCTKSEDKGDVGCSAGQLCPYILVYDIVTNSGNKLEESTTKQAFSVESCIELEKDMLMQDPYGLSGSDDEFLYDELPLGQPPPPVLPPDTLHSSVLQKFAEAITGDLGADPGKTKKSKEERNRCAKLVQSVDMSKVCDNRCCKVSSIVPFGDSEHILVTVVLCSSSGNIITAYPNETRTNSSAGTEENFVEGTRPKTLNCEHNFTQSTLAVYDILSSNSKRTLSPQPLRTKQFAASEGLFSTIVALPPESHDLIGDLNLCLQDAEAELSPERPLLVGAVKSSVILIDANSLNILTKFSLSNGNSNILHVLNCPGMDCLCACNEDGAMHFLGLRRHKAVEASQGSVGQDRTDSISQVPPAGSWSQTAVALNPNEPVSMATLLSLVQLTEFVMLMPRFMASVPSSWVEYQQDQHRLYQHTLVDPLLHTRTWKLRTENSRFLTKEQVAEIVLPRYCHVGHVDVRFSLSPMTTQPATNVYLVKPPYPSSFKLSHRSYPLPLPERQKKGILASAREQNTIVCGPVSLKMGLDSTGRHGRVTLTSPELIKYSSRILLLVFDSCGPGEDLAELSVTVARFKNNFPGECHKLRTSLLEDSSQRLLDIVVGCEPVQGAVKPDDGRKLALELLCWIAGVYVNWKTGESNLVWDVENYLPKLIRTCYLSCGRSIAHKCSRLLMMCARRAVNQRSPTESTSSFRRSLLNAILDVLQITPCAVSSGAIHWLFKLLAGFAAQADSTLTSFVCLELLEFLSSKLASSRLREHQLLRARYGLYGSPLDPVLFDALPQASTSQQSSSVVNALSGVPLTVKASSSSGGSESNSWSSVNSPLAWQGLLEVQPLHFVCCSTSDGARVERGDNHLLSGGSLGPSGTPVHVPMMSSGMPTGSALAPTLPTVSASLAALEQELHMLKQHQLQLVSLQQHKKQLEKHKKELEDMSMWPLFPKTVYKPGNVWSAPPSAPAFQPTTAPLTSTSAPINLAQHKKQAAGAKKIERASGGPVSQPIQQHLMQLPQPQMLVIDRLHAGARHHVVLDFGCVVQLTDVLIPQCSDIMSLSIDLWSQWDDPDVQRIAVVSDINLCAFVLKDLLPPPVCRYVKLTVVGRPKTNAKARVKVGEFYGHPLCRQTTISGESQLLATSCQDQQCLPILLNLLEDIHCHYNLACTQLRTLLQSSEPRTPRPDGSGAGASLTEEDKKVEKAYNQCLNLQHQLNLVERSITRLTSNTESNRTIPSLDEAKYDHLQVICNCLIDTVVALMGVGPSLEGYLAKPKLTLEWQPSLSQVTPTMCESLFRNLCVHGSPQKRERVGALLLNACGSKPWWGEFLSNVLKEFFSSSQKCTFPQERLFAVLVRLSQQSPSIELVLTSFLSLLDGLLLVKDLKVDLESADLALISWLLLLLQHVLDTCIVQSDTTASTNENGENSKGSNGKNSGTSSPITGKTKLSKSTKSNKSCKRNRWDFMLPTIPTLPSSASSESSSYWHRHLKMSKGTLAKKPQMDYPQGLTKGNGKQPYKHMKDLSKLRRHVDEGKPQPEKTASQPTTFSTSTPLPAVTTLPVMRKMVSFILSMDSSCSVELFLVACKVVAHLACVSDPFISLVDVISDDQLEKLLRMCVMPNGMQSAHWGGPWASHALTILLQDLLGGQGSKVSDASRNVTAQTPAAQENDTESSLLSKVTDYEKKGSLLTMDYGDICPSYDLPIELSGWMGDFGEIGNGSEMPQATPVHEKPSVQSSWEAKVAPPPPIKLSSAIDMRLELCLEMEAERDLKMLEHLQVDAIAKALSTTGSSFRGTTEQSRKKIPKNGNSAVVGRTLLTSFNKIFNDCASADVDVPSLLQLWLKIRLCASSITLDTESLSKLLSHVIHLPGSPSQTLQLCLQVLTCVSDGQFRNCANIEFIAFLRNEDLLHFLVRLLSQMASFGGANPLPPSPKPVKAFLTSLQLAVNSHNRAELSQIFLELLLKTTLELCTERLSNRGVVLQVDPVIDILLSNPNNAWREVQPEVFTRLVKATGELALDHLAHRRSVSLLPSADVLSGATVDKLDDSTWLVQLLSLVIQMLQNCVVKPLDNDSSQTSIDTCHGKESDDIQGVTSNSTGGSSVSFNLIDKLVSDKGIFHCLLDCLNQCTTDNQGVSGSTSVCEDKVSTDEKTSNKPASVEDGVWQILWVIQKHVGDQGVLVDAFLTFLQTCEKDGVESSPASMKHLSAPLVKLFCGTFNSSQAVMQFYEKGGLDIVCNAIMAGRTTSLDGSSHGLLFVMQELNSKPNRREPRGLLTSVGEGELGKRMFNFAPYATIHCTSSSKHPPDALLKVTAQHRRVRSPAWSYRFPVNEEWCELVVNLPTAILLNEVHIQPHSSGLSTSPSHVALDVSSDCQVLVPVCEPVLTSGITTIKLKLQQPVVAQYVHIHCHRPRDSRVVGLSQIRIMGASLHGVESGVAQELHHLKGQSASLGWVQLLGQCLSHGPEFYQETKEPSTLISDVFSNCIALLLSPRSGHSACLELVLMKLSKQFPELGTMLMKQLLKCPGEKGRKRGPLVSVATLELIYQLGKKQDSSYQDRLLVISSWLRSICDSSTSSHAAPGHIQSVAAVIWNAKETNSESVVKQYFSEELFRSLFDWSQASSDEDFLKQSIDHLIGALTYICPAYYVVLLELTGVKELLDEWNKESGKTGGGLSRLLTAPSRLGTLATASQSSITSQLLLNSGLLKMMAGVIVDFCQAGGNSQGLDKHPSTVDPLPKSNLSIDLLPHLLNFLTCCSQEPAIKDWMGETGYQLWFLLLSQLCRGRHVQSNPFFGPPGVVPSIPSHTKFAMETATVDLLCNCVHFHLRNQERMASLLVETIGGENSENGSIDMKTNVNTQVNGFLRQLILQMLLEEETVLICVHVENDLNLQTMRGFDFFHKDGWHPRFGAGHSFALLSAKFSTTLHELSEQILRPKVSKPVETTLEEKFPKPTAVEGMADPGEFSQYEGFEFLESVSLAAGLNVKSKRAEKSEASTVKENNPDNGQSQNQSKSMSCSFYHDILGNVCLPQSWTVAQLLQHLMSKGLPCGTSYLEVTCKTQDGKTEDNSTNSAPLLTPLDVFAKQDGLVKLSMHLPCHVITPSSLAPDTETEVIEGDSSDKQVPSYPTQLPLPLVSIPASVLSAVPAHTLVAFGLFIRLPGYNEVLLKDRLKARYLLRLLLGAKQDGNGEPILSSPAASCLSTLPFHVLRILFQSSELSPQEGAVVHKAAVEVGAIQMVLLCLAVLSHHKPRATNHSHKMALQALSALTGSVCRDSDVGAGSERSYWAKGTGFGTGSTSSGWDVEQAMLKQKAEEEHVTCLLQVLASYIRPFGKHSDSHSEPFAEYLGAGGPYPFVVVLLELFGESCLIPALSSYLRNDSVLDMARHVPLYQAVLEVLRALALCPVLLPLLLPHANGLSVERASTEAPSIVSLLDKMKQCVDTYSRTLRSTQGKREDSSVTSTTSLEPNASTEPSTTAEPSSKGESSSSATSSSAGSSLFSVGPSTSAGPSTAGLPSSSKPGNTEEKKDQEAEGLALLIPDIQETAKLMQRVVHEFHQQQASSNKEGEGGGKGPEEQVESLSAEERYLAKMRSLQFGTHRIVIEKDDGKLEFEPGGYHFASSVRSTVNTGGSGSMVRARRLAQEVSSLATSLPLSSSSSVFVRCDKERLDVMKVLITGPADTPYANGCFEFDVYFPQNYPESPMHINFETTGHHSIRFNPNLYNDGKVCLSILNTWHGRPEEKWNPQNSSFLQVLVSIQSLILVNEPYFNEPGYERSRGTPAGQQNSREYDANICQATVRWAMLEQLRKPSPCFKKVIEAHFYLKKDEILKQCEQWTKETESLLSGRPVGRAISHHVQSLKQNSALLKHELDKLQPPPDHKQQDGDSDEDSD